MAQDIERISPEQARQRVEAGRALLVCAYEDDSKCGAMRLPHSITLNDLQPRLASVPKNHELIFYCA